MQSSLIDRQNDALRYEIDIVFCIDGTATMNDRSEGREIPIEAVKNYALNFYEYCKETLNVFGYSLRQLRARIILFRDYLADGKYAMQVTNFFSLPQQEQDFKDSLYSIYCDGGGDDPEDGLEALAYAIRSSWSRQTPKRRYIIIVWTDADTHNIGHGKASPYYPEGMAESMEELTDWWQNPAFIDQCGKMLWLFAPYEGQWKYISDNWDLVWHVAEPIGNDKVIGSVWQELLRVAFVPDL